ncbi:Protein of Unknown Function (DUF239) [Quillaja saponaria]|uniref:Neprosin PEP catalytic domain-containing protein n=1 Tax=Quillaja saponaria TaxID=32244 RepID=A0AAD7M4J2_QUISA|nr:Protein of Unknown Function (DUF239) [Quillaja saponaria]
MRPSFYPRHQEVSNATSDATPSAAFVGLKEHCPTGTVPIRRTSKEDQLRAKANFRQQFYGSYSVKANDPHNDLPTIFFAGVSAKSDSKKRYHGGGGYVSVYNPVAGKGQFTASAISIEGGLPEEEQFSVIRVGWMVNLDAFGTNATRFYTIWGQTDEEGDFHGCYDTVCAGFVHVSTKVPLGFTFTKISVAKGPQYYVKLSVIQDKISGNWLLMYNENEEGMDSLVGYWPSVLFQGGHLVKDGAATVRLGGMTYSNTQNLPPMGSGKDDSHFRRISLVLDPWVTIGGDQIGELLEEAGSPCYTVGDDSFKKEAFWGYSFWFGGPGGERSQCL